MSQPPADPPARSDPVPSAAPAPGHACSLPRFFQWTAALDDAGDLALRQWTCGDGTRVTEELRQHLIAMIPGTERDRCAAAYREARARGGAYECEFQLVDPEGRERWFVDLGVPCPGGDRPDVLNGVTLDITERRRESDTLRERDLMLEAMSDLSHDTYWVAALDFSRVYYVSSSYGRYTGLRRDRIDEHPLDWLARVHPDDQGRIRQVLAGLAAGLAEWFSEECRMLDNDGAVREMQLRGRVLRNRSGEPYRIAGLASDVTARRTAERALRLSEERFDLANRGASDGIFDWDIPNRSLYLSPRWKEMLGLSDSDVPASETAWRDRIHPDDRDRALAYLSDYLAGATENYALEHRLRHRDGSYRWILARGTLVRDASGRPIRMVGTHTDVTDAKEMERRILAAVEDERRMIGSDLHDDIGQRLTALELMGEALLGRVRAGDPAAAATAAEITRGIRDTIGRVRRMSHGLAPQTIDPAGLADALRELARSVQTHSGIRCRYDGPGVLAVPDPDVRTHLYRIAQEAVSNAVRHARPGSIEIEVRSHGPRLTLAIRDDGCGFGAVRRNASGRGLQIMRQRATLTGAILETESRPGGGTEIRCHFGSSR